MFRTFLSKAILKLDLRRLPAFHQHRLTEVKKDLNLLSVHMYCKQSVRKGNVHDYNLRILHQDAVFFVVVFF